MGRIICEVCGKQMHPKHVDTSGKRASVYYGKNQDLIAYICPLGHIRYIRRKPNTKKPATNRIIPLGTQTKVGKIIGVLILGERYYMTDNAGVIGFFPEDAVRGAVY